MHECPECAEQFKSAQGLSSHRRSAHLDVPNSGLNRSAAQETIDQLEEMGRLEGVDRAQVQAVLSIADALDANPFNSQMWREYREALKELRADGDDDGGIEALLRELSGADVRDAPTA